jgi:hypothetical protein
VLNAYHVDFWIFVFVKLRGKPKENCFSSSDSVRGPAKLVVIYMCIYTSILARRVKKKM